MRLTRSVATLTLGVMLAASACGGGGDSSSSDEVTQVDYLTSFNTFGRDSYVYVAQEKGYFKDAGIEVSIKPGSGSVDVMKLVASGRADFGPADFPAVATTVANEDLPVTAVAMIHQKTLAALISLEGYGIEKPADLEGKKIADTPGSTVQVNFAAYAKAAGIDPAKVEFVPAAPPALPQLLASRKVDVVGQFVIGGGLMSAAAEGKPAVILPYGDFLDDLYGMALVTSKKLAESDPELVKAFTEALLKGLQYAIDHPQEAGEILKKHVPAQDAAVAAREVELMAAYVRGTESAPIGSVSKDKVSKAIATLADADVLRADITPEDLVDFDLTPQG